MPYASRLERRWSHFSAAWLRVIGSVTNASIVLELPETAMGSVVIDRRKLQACLKLCNHGFELLACGWFAVQFPPCIEGAPHPLTVFATTAICCYKSNLRSLQKGVAIVRIDCDPLQQQTTVRSMSPRNAAPSTEKSGSASSNARISGASEIGNPNTLERESDERTWSAVPIAGKIVQCGVVHLRKFIRNQYFATIFQVNSIEARILKLLDPTVAFHLPLTDQVKCHSQILLGLEVLEP